MPDFDRGPAESYLNSRLQYFCLIVLGVVVEGRGSVGNNLDSLNRLVECSGLRYVLDDEKLGIEPGDVVGTKPLVGFLLASSSGVDGEAVLDVFKGNS